MVDGVTVFRFVMKHACIVYQKATSNRRGVKPMFNGFYMYFLLFISVKKMTVYRIQSMKRSFPLLAMLRGCAIRYVLM